MKRFRRIAALLGIILLLGMYGATMFFAFSDSPDAQGMLMASIYCTIAVPVLLYAITMTAKVLDRRNRPEAPEAEQPEEPEADLPDGPFGEQEAEDPAGK